MIVGQDLLVCLCQSDCHCHQLAPVAIDSDTDTHKQNTFSFALYFKSFNLISVVIENKEIINTFLHCTTK